MIGTLCDQKRGTDPISGLIRVGEPRPIFFQSIRHSVAYLFIGLFEIWYMSYFKNTWLSKLEFRENRPSDNDASVLHLSA